MEISQIKPGQGWLNAININFADLSKESTTYTDILLLDGWQKIQNEYNWPFNVVKYPLLSGDFLYKLRLNIWKNIAPNEHGNLLMLPNEVKPDTGWLDGGTFPVEIGGHVGGMFKIWFGDHARLAYSFSPMNGAYETDAGNRHDLSLNVILNWTANA